MLQIDHLMIFPMGSQSVFFELLSESESLEINSSLLSRLRFSKSPKQLSIRLNFKFVALMSVYVFIKNSQFFVWNGMTPNAGV